MNYEEIKKALEKYYGEINNTGCYIRGDYINNWLSLEKILEIIKNLENEKQ